MASDVLSTGRPLWKGLAACGVEYSWECCGHLSDVAGLCLACRKGLHYIIRESGVSKGESNDVCFAFGVEQ